MYPLEREQAYPRNQWYMVAWSSELGSNILARTLLGTPLVLFRDLEGAAIALDDRCPHRRFPLSKGWLDKGNIVCGYHGFTFDRHGKCVHVPSQSRPVAAQKTLSYPIRERWNWIWVWLGDPDRADDSLLPDLDLVHADDPAWTFTVGGVARLAARYMLLHDNILDLSHLSYLHRNSVGSPGIASARAHSTDVANGIQVSREVCGDTMEGSPLGVALGIRGRVDRIMPQRYAAPCLHVTGPEFRSSLDGGAEPGRSFGAFRVIHAIVPETPVSTHYFWGFTRNFRQDDPAMTEALRRNIQAAMNEDIEASESIERMLSIPGGPAEIHSPADTIGAKGRRLMQRLIDAES